MKKLALLALSVMTALTMSAITYTTRVSITLDDGTYTPNLVIGESDDLAAGIVDNGYASEIMDLASLPLSIHTVFSATNYSSLTMRSMEGMPIVIKTSAQTDYTMYFDDVTGTITIYDMKEARAINVTEGDSYAFSIEAGEKNSIISDRFVYQLDIPAGNLETCFTGEELQITNNPFLGKVIITNNSTSDVHEYAYKASDTIDMSEPGEYPDGDYTVQVGSGANIRKFIVTVKH